MEGGHWVRFKGREGMVIYKTDLRGDGGEGGRGNLN